MKRAAIFLAFLLTGVTVSMTLASCAGYPPPTINILADGVIEHIDTKDMPCEHANGCYQRKVDGSRHIWRATNSPWYVARHETAHDRGMMHGMYEPWWNMGWTCATVTAGDTDGIYHKGDTICITQTDELILPHRK